MAKKLRPILESTAVVIRPIKATETTYTLWFPSRGEYRTRQRLVDAQRYLRDDRTMDGEQWSPDVQVFEEQPDVVLGRPVTIAEVGHSPFFLKDLAERQAEADAEEMKKQAQIIKRGAKSRGHRS